VSADTLYGQTCKYLHCVNQGPQVNFIAKWPLDAPADTCFAVAQGVQEAAAPAFTLRPNPTSGSVHLAFANAHQGGDRIVLSDAQGRELAQWRMAGSDLDLDLGGHAAGAYLLTLRNAAGRTLHQQTLIVEP